MRQRSAWCVALLVLLISTGIGFLSSGHGQESPRPSGVVPASATIPVEVPRPAHDVSQLPPLQQQLFLCAQRGGDWLFRSNRADGRFQNGSVPALRKPLDGDHYLRQVGAAYALARTARFLKDERYTAVARQALLTLLLETSVSGEPKVRSTALPSMIVNKLGAAGMLVLAINELPEPGADLLEQSEQLCLFIRSQQRADGSLSLSEQAVQAKSDADNPEGMSSYPGMALAGLMRSQLYQPAPWKIETFRKAMVFYRPWWQTHKTLAFVPWQSLACAEAAALSHDKACTEFLVEMNDWVLTLQYVQFDARHPLWVGGFMETSDGKLLQAAPQIDSAAATESLAHAFRVIRQGGDVQHVQQYREAIERGLQFVGTLQYTEESAQHFADWYRTTLVGGFHASHQDGNLRIDYTQQALGALVTYLTYVAEVP